MITHRLALTSESVRRVAPTIALGVVVFLAVPFFVTGLFRLDLPDYLVGTACLAVAGALASLPRHGKPLAFSWLGGCLAWATFLFWLMSQFDGLQDF